MKRRLKLQSTLLGVAFVALASLAHGQRQLVDTGTSGEVAKAYHIATRQVRVIDRTFHRADPRVLLTPEGPRLPPTVKPSPTPYEELGRDRPVTQNGEVGLASIFGTDNRVQKTSTSSYPWSTQCQIVTYYTDGSNDQGSGTVIGSKYVITAYHVVSDTGKEVSSIKVIPGLNGTTKPFGTFWASEFMYWGSDDNDDMAVIKLTSTVSGSTGTLGLAPYSDNDGKTLNIAGYPGDKGGTQQWYDSDPCQDQTTSYLWYWVDTFSGQSGSGVYRIPDGDRYVVAVHKGSGTKSGTSYNVGVRVTNGKFDDIIDYM